MAITSDVTLREAQAVAKAAELAIATLGVLESLLTHNSNLSIDWAAAVTPDSISEDEAGNITGTLFSRQEVANAIGSLDQIQRLLNNESVSQGDHLGNLSKLSRPMLSRVRID